MDNRNIISKLTSGELSVNEFAVYVAVRAKSNKGTVNTTTTQISQDLNNSLSRHAVARSLRKLQKKNLVTWSTTRGGVSTVVIW